MEQHQIPQNISSYQFRLVGDMTLKQFFQLAGGILVGLIFYSTPLPGLIKWPFIIVSVLLGAAMAFVPLEERPLEQWIVAFFQAIYSPTVFNWKKTTETRKFFADEGASEPVNSQAQDAALKNYLGSVKHIPGPLAKLEGAEQGFLSMLSGIFSGIKSSSTPITTTPRQEAPVEKKLEIPKSVPVKITSDVRPSHLVIEERAKNTVASPQIQTQKVNPTIVGEEIVSTKEAIFSVDAAPPNPPTIPNVIVGQVVDEARRIVDGVIIEIKDDFGRPIRALRSNKLGHFIAVTPLDNGNYSIVGEKDGYQFSSVNFDAKGELIPPILIEGKRLVMNTTVGTLNPGQSLHTN